MRFINIEGQVQIKCGIKRSDNNPDEFELHYLGLKVSGFENLEDAKFNAPEFARSAFQILGDFIRDS